MVRGKGIPFGLVEEVKDNALLWQPVDNTRGGFLLVELVIACLVRHLYAAVVLEAAPQGYVRDFCVLRFPDPMDPRASTAMALSRVDDPQVMVDVAGAHPWISLPVSPDGRRVCERRLKTVQVELAGAVATGDDGPAVQRRSATLAAQYSIALGIL